MKNVAAPTQRVIALFAALFFVVTMTIAGCTPGTISGPDLTPTDNTTQVQETSSNGPSATHNEGESAGRGGQTASSTQAGASRN